MANIALQDGKVVLKDGKASCACCDACSSLPLNLVLNGNFYPKGFYNYQTQTLDPPQWYPETTYYGEQCCHLYLTRELENFSFWADIYYFPNGQKQPVDNMDGGCYPCFTGYFKEATTEPTFIAAGVDFFNFIKVGSTSPAGVYDPFHLSNVCGGVTYNCTDQGVYGFGPPPTFQVSLT